MTEVAALTAHKPWCTQHGGCDDGSADWCSRPMKAGEVEMVWAADGRPGAGVSISVVYVPDELTMEEARLLHAALGEVLSLESPSV